MVGATSAQLTARRDLEHYLAKKAEGMLEQFLGPGQAVVRVAAEINFETTSRIEEKFDPESQVIRSQTKNDENVDTTSSENGGAVGLVANTPGESNVTAASTSPPNSTRNKRTLGTTEYEIGKTTSNSFQAPGGIKRLSSAVTIAARMEGTGADRKMVPRTPAELDKLRRVVENALGSVTTRGDQVVLEELVFNDQYATEINRRLEKQEREDFWWTLGRTALYPAVALLILGVFLRLLKRNPVESLPMGIPVGMFPAHEEGNGHGNGNGNGNGHGSNPAEWYAEPRVVTVEVLNKLVHDNPTNLTEAIRAWLTRGGSPQN